MFANSETVTWIGYALSALIILFMTFDGVIKLVPLDIVTEASAAIGLPTSAAFARGLGILDLVCTALYAYPKTSVLGAVLLTGYFGGAVVTHLRIGSPIFSHLLFGVYLGLMAWGGLYLRDERLRAIFPFRT
jgi:hypothetical protein